MRLTVQYIDATGYSSEVYIFNGKQQQQHTYITFFGIRLTLTSWLKLTCLESDKDDCSECRDGDLFT